MNNKWFLSSTGSGDLAMTIKGLLMTILPLLVFLAQSYDIPLAENELVEIINAIVAAIAAMVTLGGLVRKYYKAKEKYWTDM